MADLRLMDKLSLGKHSAFTALLFIVILWAVIFLPGLGSFELKGEEARRVMPALDMIKSGQYLIPYIGGEPYFNKPPMINWIIIASVKVFHSSSEFFVRLPSPLSLLTLCLVILYLPCRQFCLELRFLACVVLLGCLGIASKGRLIEIETIYLCQTAIACFWWFYRKMDGGHRWDMYFVPMFCLAFALLTKGPLAFLVFYSLIICVSAKTKSWRHFFCYQHLICLVIVFGLFYLWYHAVDVAGFADLRDQRIEKEVGNRFSRLRFEPDRIVEEGTQSIMNFMPWLLIMPICWMKHFIDNIPSEQRPYFCALRMAFVVSFIIVIIMPKTLSRYSLPTVPLGLFVFAWVIYYNKPLERSDKAWKFILLIFVAAVSLAALAGLFYTGFNPTAFITAVVFAVIVYFIFVKHLFQDNRTGLVVLTAIVVGMIMNLYNAFGCVIAKPENMRQKTAAHIESAIPENELLYICYPGYQAFIYYLQNDYEYIAPGDIIDSNANCVLIRDRHLEAVPQLSNWKIVDELVYRKDRNFLLLQRP